MENYTKLLDFLYLHFRIRGKKSFNDRQADIMIDI